ncbi:MAG: hypothetical protein RSF34_13655 [Flavobacterium sp.]|uniref:hypothetical protein n=1 Tax=Flavobacterium sp. TaxID=239 RepID=UPI002FC9D292
MKRVPQGDLLRQYLLKSSISTTLLSDILKGKNVLIRSKNKKATLPYFLKTIIDAKLFNEIESKEVVKEKQQKFTNASIKVKNDFKLEKLTDLKLDLHNELIEKSEFKLNYSFKNAPEFYIESIDKNQIKVALDIEIEIEDQLENFRSTTIERNAKIDVVLDNDVLIINKNYTSPETKEVVDFVVESVRKFLKQEHYINKNDDFFTIRFDDFKDAKRVEFLKSFQNISTPQLTYKSIVDLDIEYKDNHKGFDKLLDSISSMKIRGMNLENHPFVSDLNYYSKIVVSGIKVKYDFDLGTEKGEIILDLGFPGYKSDAVEESLSNPVFEFSINVSNCLHKSNVYKITSDLAVLIEKYKNGSYPHYKS